MIKIYDSKDFVRIAIKQQLSKTETFSLSGITQQKCLSMFKKIIGAHSLSPFSRAKRTTIDIREDSRSKFCKTEIISFTGLTPKQTRNLIFNHIKKLK